MLNIKEIESRYNFTFRVPKIIIWDINACNKEHELYCQEISAAYEKAVRSADLEAQEILYEELCSYDPELIYL